MINDIRFFQGFWRQFLNLRAGPRRYFGIGLLPHGPVCHFQVDEVARAFRLFQDRSDRVQRIALTCSFERRISRYDHKIRYYVRYDDTESEHGKNTEPCRFLKKPI